MKDDCLSYTAFAIVIGSVVSALATIAFSEGIERSEWMDLASVSLACFGLLIVGCVLGWCAFNRSLGKIAAILGSLVVVGVVLAVPFALLGGDIPEHGTHGTLDPGPPPLEVPLENP